MYLQWLHIVCICACACVVLVLALCLHVNLKFPYCTWFARPALFALISVYAGSEDGNPADPDPGTGSPSHLDLVGSPQVAAELRGALLAAGEVPGGGGGADRLPWDGAGMGGDGALVGGAALLRIDRLPAFAEVMGPQVGNKQVESLFILYP